MTIATDKSETADTAPGPIASVPADKAEKHPEKRKALGRGLESLLPSSPALHGPKVPGAHVPLPPAQDGAPHAGMISEIHAQAEKLAAGEAILQIALDHIDANPYQTRVEFDKDALEELSKSIRASGVLSPIVVRPAREGRYVLVLGERRCRASKMAGTKTIPAIVRRISDQVAAEMTVVENLQRQDLNCMEQAAAFQKLSQRFGLTQAQIGDRVGISRESVANYMRLLRLPGTVMDYLMKGWMSFSEARELLKLDNNEVIEKIAKQVVDKQLSFLRLQDLVGEVMLDLAAPLPDQPAMGRARWVDPNVRAAQNELQRALGLKVKISDRRGRGKIVIEYASVDDYQRVVEMLRGRHSS